MMLRHGIVGRLTKNIAGTAARKKRTAASANGGTSRSAILMGTNAKPNKATTAMISARSGAVSEERAVNGSWRWRREAPMVPARPDIPDDAVRVYFFAKSPA